MSLLAIASELLHGFVDGVETLGDVVVFALEGGEVVVHVGVGCHLLEICHPWFYINPQLPRL